MRRRRALRRSIFLTSLSLAGLITTTITFAWFSSDWRIADQKNQPGLISTTSVMEVWDLEENNENKWKQIPANSVAVYLGEMQRVDQLPEDSHKSYFLFNAVENNNVPVHYEVRVTEITVELYSYRDDEFITDEAVGYYDYTPAQTIYNSYSYTSTSSGLNPETIFNDLNGFDEVHINERNLSLTNDLIAPDEYLYLNLVPRLTEVQALVDNIPPIYAPYALYFTVNFSLEARTIDEN